jgi:hypothetical protein
MDFIEQELAPHIPEFRPPRTPTDHSNEFYLDNGFYGPVDAELLYAMVRRLRPRRIVELGSGFSTLVMAKACVANAHDEAPCSLRVFNPYPEPLDFRGNPVVGVSEYQGTPAQEVPNEVFASLDENDILFIDTSHIVKLGSDTAAIVLEKVPLLRAGVFVHFHDVFIPWNYPRSWVESFDAFPYAEQYLVHAFLSFNRAFEPVCAAYAVARDYGDRLKRAIPSYGPDVVARAFWIRCVSEPPMLAS